MIVLHFCEGVASKVLPKDLISNQNSIQSGSCKQRGLRVRSNKYKRALKHFAKLQYRSTDYKIVNCKQSINEQTNKETSERGACKNGKVEKEQTNALRVDYSSTERYIKGRRNRFVDRERWLISENIAVSSKPDAHKRLDEDVNAIRSLVANLFARHEADLAKTLRVYTLFRLSNPKTCPNFRLRLLKAVA
ncbi:hypothetical protein GJ496_011001 [Pomphorhynchus laevis]|nr:hypothetical protein GJ496_011001 [Pomphorhynchus laevis]